MGTDRETREREDRRCATGSPLTWYGGAGHNKLVDVDKRDPGRLALELERSLFESCSLGKRVETSS